ncbi:MAG: hypothetical protein HZC17_02045 [Candidatus Omnitrophica bacterium]|nr:hypothetical protein [Candidatus Omnitrophota bacterium]
MWLKEEKEGLAEFESRSSLPEVIAPNQYVYGVLSFDEKALEKGEKPVFRMLESEGIRNIEIRGFAWICVSRTLRMEVKCHFQRCCMKDERRPLGAVFGEKAPNRLKLLQLKTLG